MENKNKEGFKTIKAASPDNLFDRFLQRKAPAPAPEQLSTWEDDGGVIPNDGKDLILIAGMKCSNVFQRMRARLYKYWRALSTPTGRAT